MINQDVIDLYDKVSLGAKVVVLSNGRESAVAAERPARRANRQNF